MNNTMMMFAFSLLSALAASSVTILAYHSMGFHASIPDKLTVSEIEVVGQDGVVARLGGYNEAGSLFLYDPKQSGGRANQFMSFCKIRDGEYGFGIAVPGNSAGLRLGVSPGGMIEVSDGSGAGCTWSLGANSTSGRIWLIGTAADPESVMMKLEATEAGGGIFVGEASEGGVRLRRK